ncbi:hypothetical protein MBAV_006150 [Candidatus Magnetobacterium bavaricum]|uniref:Uncharacterized protein n=1 Tax=Candidatus Magnetobacterium bavaricum TaxID=29290 RepID=A0A0F3GIJ3_9BACT|nr:hypothetical protein MBAV_006150 [Candidatus Magnetobacterium bavaricum]
MSRRIGIHNRGNPNTPHQSRLYDVLRHPQRTVNRYPHKYMSIANYIREAKDK